VAHTTTSAVIGLSEIGLEVIGFLSLLLFIFEMHCGLTGC
jgi:hypothetical protein